MLFNSLVTIIRMGCGWIGTSFERWLINLSWQVVELVSSNHIDLIIFDIFVPIELAIRLIELSSGNINTSDMAYSVKGIHVEGVFQGEANAAQSLMDVLAVVKSYL